jgi:hypothetical protein
VALTFAEALVKYAPFAPVASYIVETPENAGTVVS